MKIRFSFKNHISHAIFVYLSALIVVPLICSYSILLKTKPKDYERFSFFSEALYVNDGMFKDELFKILPEDLVIDLYDMDRSDRTFNSYLSSHGLNSDICLLSETTISKFETIPFLNLSNTSWDKEDNYKKEDYSFGIKCQQALDSIFTFKEETYYLCVVKSSVHLKGIKKNGQTDQVNRVLEYLTTYE